ncbi:MAG: rod shape-determining protein MreC [Bacteroidetes bacterium]|nr:rod shape-determining protein MreC [Bacteroidota bacterium]
MQQIIFFFIRNKNFLLFCVLFLLSLSLIVKSHSFHKSKFVNSANFLSGGIYSLKSNVTSYFNLKEKNNLLIEENARIRKVLEGFKESNLIPELDSLLFPSKYNFIPARIINNSYSKTKNRLTLSSGAKNNIKIDMGVITSNGIVGIIDNVSKNYATVQSILNTKSQINAKLKSSYHFGTLIWNTNNSNIVQLVDVPRLAPVVLGDTITTGGKSTIFPKGILIGTIKDFSLGDDENYYNINIQLFNDMTNLEHVYVIENIDIQEIMSIEKGVENEKY